MPIRRLIVLPILVIAGGCAVEAPADSSQNAPLDLSAWERVDLTHTFDERTIYWPTSPGGFEMDTLAYGMTEGGWFYSAHAVSTPEHGGTHLDAPIHFAEGGIAAHEIPLERLVANAVVIDVSDSAAANPDYLLSAADLRSFEQEHGLIPDGSIVLLRTGWSPRWPDRRAYLGDDTPGDASNLHFPSFGEEAATILVAERRVAALGADVASIDGGSSTDFRVHRIAGGLVHRTISMCCVRRACRASRT